MIYQFGTYFLLGLLLSFPGIHSLSVETKLASGALIVLLGLAAQMRMNLSLRRPEIEVWQKLGANSQQIFWAFGFKNLFVPITGFMFSLLFAGAAFWFAPQLFPSEKIAPNIQSTPFKAPFVEQGDGPVPPLAHFWDRKRVHNLQSERQGLVMEAIPGEPVSSPLDGKVVYDGQLKGLGRMIIIDHGEGLHSVYAHLGELKTRIDERLQRGQVLGYIGDNVFYFELRQNGKPTAIDPFFRKP